MDVFRLAVCMIMEVFFYIEYPQPVRSWSLLVRVRMSWSEEAGRDLDLSR